MKRGIVFILSLFLISSFIFSCSSSSEYGSSGGIRHIYEESSNNAMQVSGIKIASNYIELTKENGGGTPLYYNIGASAQPVSAANKALIYTSSDPKLAEVSSDGMVTIKDLGTFSITIKSASREDICQKVDFYVRENIRTDLDIEHNPLSLFGSYSISQYGINKSPDTNIVGSFSINADKSSAENPLSAYLLFNGLDISVNLNIDDISSMSYDNVANAVFSYLDGKIKDEKTVIIALKAEDHTELVKNQIIKDGETLYLALKKEYDLVPGQSHVQEIPVSVTDIQIKDEHELDRRISTTYMLKPIVLPVNASNKAVTYYTSDNKVAAVSPTGVVTALNEGSANIIVKSVSNDEVIGTTAFTIVDSTERVKDIVFEKMNETIYIGDSVTVKATALPDNATYKDIFYYSKNPLVATVNSATGVITPRGKGTVTIAAVSDKGSIEKTIKLTVDVYQPAEPVKYIVNTPSKLALSLESTKTVQLNGKAVPTYADDTALSYKADESGCVSVDDKGLVTALKVGTGIVTVYSHKYPDVKKDITIAVREKEEKIFVSEIKVNKAPSTLYISHTDHTIIPEIIPAEANIDHELTVSADDNSIVRIEQIGNQYKIVPLQEGSVIITVKTANGVEQEVPLNVKKVMNVKGYYTIDKVEYTLADKTESFTSEKDKLQGEFAINLLEDKYTVQGRLQYTPENPLVSYAFNNWRYIYENKEIILDTEDKYSTQTKDMLSTQNIKVTGANTVEYTYTQDSFKAVIYLTKVNDEVKEILDRTMYMTSVDMEKDPHSAEGYYQMTWFYGNPYNQSNTGYQPKFSHNKADKPSSSDLGISYLSAGRKCLLFNCLGGKGDGGTVKSYKGAFAVKVDGTEEVAGLSSIMKVQMNGHEDVTVAWQKYLMYIHAVFNSVNLNQNISLNNNKIIDNSKSLKASILSNDGKTYPSETATIAYTILQDNQMQFEMKFHDEWPTYEFMYRAVKVSDRYIDLPTDKFVDGDVNDREQPEIPDLAKIVPVEVFTGSVTAIE